MIKDYKIFWSFFALVFVLDQIVKILTLRGMRYQSEYLDLTFALNTGVAFSMLSFLEHYLKYLHLAILLILFSYLFWQKEFLKEHIIAFGLMLGAGCSNLLDRFIHGGVVDMFFWHKGFEFAIFNVADVMINLSVALILIKEIFLKRGKNDRVD
ncbi:lipoprotein signal peptidase [Campylobacter upsaliensis]|uniref:signal peptidase II n=1 Tax=Campylobacter upsaliensis TaxID=28080 RepID=UPI00126EF6C7|nr:signal peptidase II [Campylobacter upsaliensis]EAH5885784.1 lipoprotein signal peptidase [Campylobacter upsaliensis]EAH8538424.1 lipoprotein signal peptidase [Campylobacter upsaliensis]EAH9986588.1 lipoprotein signal peptidase [Campylobacter upsaliensis]EAI0686335.1 lipoprotein signal peptidase [Campylobacter upsaliensis]EAI3917400.1 lipoprotein signal peptidase [Campylobacter upsaliensis]